MRETTISVTDAARNFADCVNRVRYQNVTFVLLRNGSPVARLVPENKQGGTGFQSTVVTRKNVDMKFVDVCSCGDYRLQTPSKN